LEDELQHERVGAEPVVEAEDGYESAEHGFVEENKKRRWWR
jgi:hypothetical protein